MAETQRPWADKSQEIARHKLQACGNKAHFWQVSGMSHGVWFKYKGSKWDPGRVTIPMKVGHAL